VSESRRGVLIAEGSPTDQFSSDDVSFLTLLAHWIGIIAERAELAETIAIVSTERARRTAAEELMTVLAHDLGDLLTPLRGHIDLLRRRAVRDGREEDVRGADEASQALTRMQQLIEDLLDASRLEGGLFSLSMAQIDLVGLVREVAERFQEEEHPINLRLPQAMTLQGDASRICQALENLLSNAVHHGPKGVPIHLYLGEEERGDGTWAVIEVRDAGPGIATELLPGLFDRFSKDSSSQGLGLGLYLARGIAHAHGGDLAVDSQIGRGAMFRLTLPLEIG
jgi:two-component system, OmpR family, sensor kinase